MSATPETKLLSDEQIAATLRRHRYSPDTQVLGITYGTVVTVNVYGQRLIVPTDILRGDHETYDEEKFASGEVPPAENVIADRDPLFPRE